MGTRLATTEDAETIASLLSEMKQETIQEDTLGIPEFIARNQAAIILATSHEGEIVGMAIVNLLSKLTKIECRVDEVIVTSTARGEGYGRSLLEACETWAWDNNADMIELTSRPSREAANHLYQSSGFELRDTNVYTKKRPNA